jgi:PAS domain S-box-containing protein
MQPRLGDSRTRTESSRALHVAWQSPKLMLSLLGILLLFQGLAPAQVREVRRVLILNELGLWSPGVSAINKEIFAALEKSPYQIEFYSEDLDTSLFPDEASQREARDWYFRRYRNRKLDLIIAIGPSPIKFMSESHQSFSPGTPIVFWGSTEEFAEPPRLDSTFTGVWGVAQPDKTLEAALQLQPHTKHVVVVGGVAPYDRYLEGLVKQRFQKYGSKLNFTYLTDLAMPDLLERLKHLQSHTIVYHTSVMEDAAGNHFIDAVQAVPMLARAANAPIFTVDDVDVGTGAVGGYVFSFTLAGQTAAGMAIRILNGEKPQDIAIVRGANTYLFDWRALKRWGLMERDLPPGSVVLNRQLTMWEAYKAYIISGISLILAEALLIFGLLWQRTRRRAAETELAITYDRLRMAVEAGRSVGWDWDIKSGRDRWFGDLETVFGIPTDSYSGHVDDFRRKIYPEDRELVWQAVADARKNRTPYIAEFRVVRTDGTVRWITARGKFYYSPNGDSERMLGMAVDITDRKLAEEALRGSEQRLRLAVQAGKMYAYEWDAATDTIVRSDEFADILGTDQPAHTSRRELIVQVYPDDREQLAAEFTKVTPESPYSQVQYRLLRPDGNVLWLERRARAFYDDEGKLQHIVGVVADITDRKQAEHKLRESEDRLAGIVGSAMDAIIAVDEEQQVVLFNAAAEKMFGCSQSEAVGTIVDRFIPQSFRSENGAHIRRFGESGVTTRAMGTLGALWALRKNGEGFPIEASISHVESDGRKLFTVIIRDITERRLAEQAVHESEERFRLVANTAPVMIWMSGTDKLCNYFNQPWLDFTGRSIEAELGNGWAELVHPLDFQACLDTYQAAFDRREHFEMQYRLRRHDGEYRWLLDIGVPRFDSGGSFAGYIGSCIDVTDRKLAEEAMADIGRRLIDAHEEERTWIGRELHDDINQRLALAVIELERWGHSKSEVELHEHIGHVKQRLSDLGKDVQALSHRLHSSKLDYLGLTVAANSFCREFSEQQKVEIDFTHKDMPSRVSKEISLCLFRILQEALQNAVKYSGVRHFSVKFEGTPAEIQLTVSDHGIGFDPHNAFSGRGLGLISMRERVQLVKGELSVTSRPAGGTTVFARVPFNAEERRTSLAG